MIVCDYFHVPQQGDWKFDKAYWPDPAAMVKELTEMGIHLLVLFGQQWIQEVRIISRCGSKIC